MRSQTGLTTGVPGELPITSFTPLSVEEALARFDFSRDTEFPYSIEWNNYCDELGIFEYPTKEYVATFSTYLAGRIGVIGARCGEVVRVLEVAAGTGILTQLLFKALKDMDVEVEMKAVDDKSWLNAQFNPTIAETMDYRKAVPQFRPHIIIAAWVPGSRMVSPGRYEAEDWTACFRQNDATEEYVLIGKTTRYERHASPEAWGYTYDEWSTNEVKVEVPEYERDGFDRIDLVDLRPTQLCYMSTIDNLHPSETVVFRRRVTSLAHE